MRASKIVYLVSPSLQLAVVNAILTGLVMYRIVEDDAPPIPPGLPEDLDHFLTLCFQKEPRARPTARQLFGHPWLLKFCPELVSQYIHTFASSS